METKRICPSCQKTLPPNVPLGLCPECLIKSGFSTGTEPGNPGKESGFVPPPVEEIRKLFPQLEIIELIGKGGMGAVYKARQPTLDRLVALKILPPGAADDAGFAERFNREARALAKLNHPHIVAVHDFGQAGGQPYLVMEFVDGPNLRQVEQAGRLTTEQALQIVPQICEALQFAHNEGVVHRDIKPENILLDKKGRVKITDFGIAKIVGAPAGKISLTGAKDVIGTPHYMAPEQIEKPQTVDHRADIYSLGVVFYELLTGELPLGKFAPPSKKVQVDVRLDEVVLHTLEKEPDRRYQHASEVKTDVETITHPRSSTPIAGPPANVGTASSGAEAAWRLVKGPAIGLVVTGILNWLAIPLISLAMAWVVSALGSRRSYMTYPSAIVILVPLSALVLSSVMIVAGLKMKRLEAYGLAITGSILAILVTPGNLIGLPIGIWALVVLSHREVREAFGKRYPHRAKVTAASAPTALPPDRFWRRFAVALVAVALALILIPVGSILVAITVPSFIKARHRAHMAGAATLSQEGWRLWQGGHPVEAIPKFQSAVELNPTNTAAWNGLGWASFNAGKTAEAEKAFKKVIELEPDHPAALNGLGQLYLAQKKYAEAESYLLKAAPKAPAAWYGLARLYLLQGKFAEAEKWAQKLVDSGQADATANKMLQAARDRKLSEGLRLMIEPK